MILRLFDDVVAIIGILTALVWLFVLPCVGIYYLVTV